MVASTPASWYFTDTVGSPRSVIPVDGARHAHTAPAGSAWFGTSVMHPACVMGSVAAPSATLRSADVVTFVPLPTPSADPGAIASQLPVKDGAVLVLAGHCVRNAVVFVVGLAAVPSTNAARNWLACVLIDCHWGAGFCALECPTSANTMYTG